MKRFVPLVLVAALSVAVASPAIGDSEFVDDNGNTHEQAIDQLANRGITKGCNPPANDRYCPDGAVTRGQFAAFLVRALDLPIPDKHPFRDTVGSTFEREVAALAASGITRGCNPPDNTRFCPDDRLTRGQLAALLARGLELPNAGEDYFADDDGGIFEGDINRLAAAGITRGCESFGYCPNRTLSRAEMASFLVRTLSGGGEPPPPREQGGGEDAGDSDVVGSVEPPKDAIAIEPSDNAQKVINQHPTGTAFLLKSGVHRLFSVEPKSGNSFYGEAGTVLSGTKLLSKFDRRDGAWVATGQTQQIPFYGQCESGTTCQMAESVWIEGKELRQVTTLSALEPGKFYFDYERDAIYLADDPRGRRVEASVAKHAFSGGADDVSILGVVIEKYANPAQSGAIEPAMHSDAGLNWVLTDSEIRENHGEGVRLGSGMRVLDTWVHHNGRLGIIGASGFSGATLARSEISHNCSGGFKCFGWGGGGLKVGQGSKLTVVDNHFHSNHGTAIHADNGMRNVTFIGNKVVDNDGVGISIEISSDAVIERNTVSDNGHHQDNGFPGPGIVILASSDVVVRGNRVIDNGHGIVLRQTSRGAEHVLDNVRVVDNDISMRTGVTGVYSDTTNDVYSRNLTFNGNAYDLGSGARYYYWLGAKRTVQEWKQYGHDRSGSWD